MHLTKQEEEMLEGEHGESVSEAMRILVAIGDVYEATKLIPVRSAHIAGISYKSHGDAGIEYAENLLQQGARTKIHSSLNTIGVDMERWRSMGLPEGFSTKQTRIGR